MNYPRYQFCKLLQYFPAELCQSLNLVPLVPLMAQAVETHIDARIDQKFSIATSFLVKNSIVFELLIF